MRHVMAQKSDEVRNREFYKKRRTFIRKRCNKKTSGQDVFHLNRTLFLYYGIIILYRNV